MADREQQQQHVMKFTATVHALRDALVSLPPALLVESLRCVSARPVSCFVASDVDYLAGALVKEVWEIGAEQLVGHLSEATRNRLAKGLDDAEDSPHDDIVERLETWMRKAFTATNPELAFAHTSRETLQACANDLSVTAIDHSSLNIQLVGESLFMGVEKMLSLLPESILREYLEEWKPKSQNQSSSLVDRAMMHVFTLTVQDLIIGDETPTTSEAEGSKSNKKTKLLATKVQAKQEKQREVRQTDAEAETQSIPEEPPKKASSKRKLGNKTTTVALVEAEEEEEEEEEEEPKKATAAKKKRFQLPPDMQDLTVGMKENQIARKYKVDQLKLCLRMNGLDEDGLKAKLVSRLRTHMLQMHDEVEEDEENRNPNRS